jgi:hypothetical protein
MKKNESSNEGTIHSTAVKNLMAFPNMTSKGTHSRFAFEYSRFTKSGNQVGWSFNCGNGLSVISTMPVVNPKLKRNIIYSQLRVFHGFSISSHLCVL